MLWGGGLVKAASPWASCWAPWSVQLPPWLLVLAFELLFWLFCDDLRGPEPRGLFGGRTRLCCSEHHGCKMQVPMSAMWAPGAFRPLFDLQAS